MSNCLNLNSYYTPRKPWLLFIKYIFLSVEIFIAIVVLLFHQSGEWNQIENVYFTHDESSADEIGNPDIIWILRYWMRWRRWLFKCRIKMNTKTKSIMKLIVTATINGFVLLLTIRTVVWTHEPDDARSKIIHEFLFLIKNHLWI